MVRAVTAFLKRKCRFCKMRNVVQVLSLPQPNDDETKVEYVRATKCHYCGAMDA